MCTLYDRKLSVAIGIPTACAIDAVDLDLLDSGMVNYNGSERMIEHIGGSANWTTIGMKGVHKTGERSMTFKPIVMNSAKEMMFGVMPLKKITTDSYIYNKGGVCYYPWKGGQFGYAPGSYKVMTPSIAIGDTVKVTVNIIDDTMSKGTITFYKNDAEIATEALEKYIYLKDGVVFAVSMYYPGEMIQIV